MLPMATLVTAATDALKSGSAKGRVLIVDDEPNVRLVFRTALESSGFTVEEAGTGSLAITRQLQEPSDVVLLDLLMPGIGGMEVLRRLREAGSEVPVVVVTAHGSIPDAVAAMKLGAIDFLSKPLTPDALRSVVSEVISRHASEHAEQTVNRALQPKEAPQIAILPFAIDLSEVKLALNNRQFQRALQLLDEALDLAPYSTEALTLRGVVFETEGRKHSAYQSYREALSIDPTYVPALQNMQRYCEKFGLDFSSKSINPAAKG